MNYNEKILYNKKLVLDLQKQRMLQSFIDVFNQDDFVNVMTNLVQPDLIILLQVILENKKEVAIKDLSEDIKTIIPNYTVDLKVFLSVVDIVLYENFKLYIFRDYEKLDYDDIYINVQIDYNSLSILCNKRDVKKLNIEEFKMNYKKVTSNESSKMLSIVQVVQALVTDVYVIKEIENVVKLIENKSGLQYGNYNDYFIVTVVLMLTGKDNKLEIIFLDDLNYIAISSKIFHFLYSIGVISITKYQYQVIFDALRILELHYQQKIEKYFNEIEYNVISEKILECIKL